MIYTSTCAQQSGLQWPHRRRAILEIAFFILINPLCNIVHIRDRKSVANEKVRNDSVKNLVTFQNGVLSSI